MSYKIPEQNNPLQIVRGIQAIGLSPEEMVEWRRRAQNKPMSSRDMAQTIEAQARDFESCGREYVALQFANPDIADGDPNLMVARIGAYNHPHGRLRHGLARASANLAEIRWLDQVGIRATPLQEQDPSDFYEAIARNFLPEVARVSDLGRYAIIRACDVPGNELAVQLIRRAPAPENIIPGYGKTPRQYEISRAALAR